MRTASLRNIALLILLCCSTSNTFAQTTIKTQYDAKQIMIGDQLRMFITVDKDKNDQLQWATIPDTFNSLEIVERGKIDTIKGNNDNTIRYKQKLLVTGFDSGAFTIPAFQFPVKPANDTLRLLSTDSLSLLVQTVAVDTTKAFKDIKNIREAQLTWLDYKEYIFGIGGGLLLLGLLIAFILMRKKKGPIIPKKPNETPHEKALRLLKELEAQQLWQNDKVKEYYIELTDILRNYIEEQHNIEALELTSDELLSSMKQNRLLKVNRKLIRPVLQTADLAKFAKAKPLPQEHIDALENTKAFITVTKPQPTGSNNNNS